MKFISIQNVLFNTSSVSLIFVLNSQKIISVRYYQNIDQIFIFIFFKTIYSLIPSSTTERTEHDY